MPNRYLRPGLMALGSLAAALFFPLAALALPTPSVNDVTVVEGNTGTVSADFTLSLSEPSTLTAQVSWSVGAGTASSNDYEQRSGSAVFSPGETTKVVSIIVKGDLTDEPDEIFLFHLDRFILGQQAQSMNDTGVGTILDDDTPPSISVGNALVAEGSEGEAVAVFTVSLSAPSGWAVTADFATADGTALAGGDYDATVGTLTFAPGLISQEVTVRVNRDAEAEPAETFFLDLSNPDHVTIADGQGLGTITDDPVPSISVGDVTVSEVGPLVFTLALSGASTKTVKVNFSMAAGTTEVSGVDYSTQSGTLSFNPGQTSKTISVSIYQDDMDEEDETFYLNLANPINATLLDPQALGTILDDDDPPTFNFGNVTVAEGINGTLNLSLGVMLSKSIGRTLSVDYTTADGAALAPEDYLAASGTLVVLSGATSRQWITVVVKGDLTYEPDETFTVTLSNPVNVVPLGTTSTVTIKNDDSMPGIAVNNVTVTEGNAGTADAVFTVTLSRPSYQAITVDYATADGTALAPADYAPVSGTLSFAPGETAKTFSAAVNGDLLDEVNETFSVNLSAQTNAIISDAQGIGTITDDDLPPSLSISDAAVTEGNTGPTNATFTVSLSAPSSQTVTVNYSTADGTALAGVDYVANSGTLTFTPGQTTSKTVTVVVNGDLLDEPNETFLVNLSNLANATLADAQGIGTTLDDDNPPVLSIGDMTLQEGNSGTADAVFTATLSAPSGQTVTANYSTADGTALAGLDYAATSGTLSFAPGETAKILSVAVSGDLLNEPNETFFVNLSNSTNATLARSQGRGTIQDDDPVPVLRIDDLTLTEGNTGTTAATFTLTLSSPSGQTLSVDFATAGGTAQAPGDFAAQAGALAFAPGQTSQTISVPVNGDALYEPDEVFFVNLANISGNALIADAQGQGTLLNDDPLPTLAIADLALNEGDAGILDAAFILTLSNPSGQPLGVDFATMDGTATAGTDYAATSGTLTFDPGETSKAVSVQVNGDLLDEPDEAFFLNLALSSGTAAIADAQGLGAIRDDDAAPEIRIDDVALAETDAGTSSALFTATLSAPSGQTVSVDFATVAGTALAGSDYTPLTGTLTFSPGTTTQTLAVAVNGDLTFEVDETFSVQLANPANATLADAQGQGLIQNDDQEPTALAPITGTWDVTFGQSDQVRSEVFSGGDLRLNGGSKSQPGLLEGSVEAVGDVRIEAYNHLTGDVTAGGQVKLPAKKQAGTVQLDGVLSEQAAVAPVTLPSLSFAVNPSNAPKVSIKKREARDLAPYEQAGRAYGELKAEQHATLTLHSGTYYFQRFTLRHHCELILDLQGGPLTINIKEGMHLGHHVKVTLRGGDAGQVLFNVAGPGLSEEEGEEDEDRDEWVPQDRQGRRDFAPALAVRILQNTQFAGTLYAPQGKIRVGHHSQVTGALLARQVRLHQQVDFTGQVARHLVLSSPLAKPVALAELPRGFALEPNYPNPFNPSTTLRYALSDLSQVRLAIYNALGQQLRVLVDGVQEAGSYTVAWDGLDERGQQAGAGVYFYRLEIGAEVLTRKMALVR